MCGITSLHRLPSINTADFFYYYWCCCWLWSDTDIWRKSYIFFHSGTYNVPPSRDCYILCLSIHFLFGMCILVCNDQIYHGLKPHSNQKKKSEKRIIIDWPIHNTVKWLVCNKNTIIDVISFFIHSLGTQWFSLLFPLKLSFVPSFSIFMTITSYSCNSNGFASK